MSDPDPSEDRLLEVAVGVLLLTVAAASRFDLDDVEHSAEDEPDWEDAAA